MARPRSTRIDQVAQMAARPEGVTNADVQAAFELTPVAAGSLLSAAKQRCCLFNLPRRVGVNNRARWFTREEGARSWMQRQLAYLKAVLRAQVRLKAGQAGTEPAAGPLCEGPPGRTAKPAKLAKARKVKRGVAISLQAPSQREAKARQQPAGDEPAWKDLPAVTTARPR